MPTPVFIETNFAYTNVETDYWSIIPKCVWISKSKVSKPTVDDNGHRLDKIIASVWGVHITPWFTICFNKAVD